MNGHHAPIHQSEVQRRFREWMAAEYRAADHRLSDDEANRLSDAACKLADALAEVPSETVEDVSVKISALTSFGAFGMPRREMVPLLWAELDAMRRGLPLPKMEGATL